MSKDEARQPQPLQFVETLQYLDNKRLLDDLTVAMEEVAAAVRATQKKGAVTLKLSIEPRAKGSGGTAVRMTPEVKMIRPEFSRVEEFFFTNEQGQVARDEFRQGLVDFETAGNAG